MNVVHWIGIDDHADKWTIAHLRGSEEKPTKEFELIPNVAAGTGFVDEAHPAAECLREGQQLPIACVEGIEYMDGGAPRLTTYYPDYSISDDVVLNGRAACYLDLYGGQVSYVPPPVHGRGAGFVTIEMKTHGLPELLVTPLAQWSTTIRAMPAYRVRLPESDDPERPITLKVKNVELMVEKPADEALGSFDFMLHYLTARGGIPEWITWPTPGMPQPLPIVSPDRVAGALRELADAVALANDRTTAYVLQPESDFTEACAPSQYP